MRPGSVGTVETRYLDLPKAVQLDCGQELHPVRVAYETYGASCTSSSTGGGLQYFYLARERSWSASAADRSGPEFTDPTRGQYQLQLIPLTAEAVEGIDLKPDALAQFLPDLPAWGIDLFALPDLRASQPTRI